MLKLACPTDTFPVYFTYGACGSPRGDLSVQANTFRRVGAALREGTRMPAQKLDLPLAPPY